MLPLRKRAHTYSTLFIRGLHGHAYRGPNAHESRQMSPGLELRGILIRLRVALDHKRKLGPETPTPTARTRSSRPIGRRIADPPIEVRFAPTAAMFAELHLRRKRTVLHLAVDRGAAETSALQNSTHANDFVGFRHGRHSFSCGNSPRQDWYAGAGVQADSLTGGARAQTRRLKGGVPKTRAHVGFELRSGQCIYCSGQASAFGFRSRSNPRFFSVRLRCSPPVIRPRDDERCAE